MHGLILLTLYLECYLTEIDDDSNGIWNTEEIWLIYKLLFQEDIMAGQKDYAHIN